MEYTYIMPPIILGKWRVGRKTLTTQTIGLRSEKHVMFRRVEVGGRPVGGSNGMYLRRYSASRGMVAEGVNTAA